MTEKEWLAAWDPDQMRAIFPPERYCRKEFLFACACCRRIWDLLDERSRRAVVAAEGFADGAVSRGELEWAGRLAKAAFLDALGRHDPDGEGAPAYFAAMAADDLATTSAAAAQCASYYAASARAGTTYPRATRPKRKVWLRERTHQRWLLLDIVGDPFRPVAVDPAWRTEEVIRFAKTAYVERAFDRLPILADLLEEAGATDALLLRHLRGPGFHTRGCHALDAVLGI
jgi:hypothetical protein